MTNRKYFGTDGIRGIANLPPMTADIALKIGAATGLYVSVNKKAKRVVIAKDTRLSGYMLESAITSGLTSVGLDVFLLGPMPTPSIAMMMKSMRADLGIMISASHNTYEYNGIKIFGPDGYKLSDENESEIEKIIQNLDNYDLGKIKIGKAKRIDDAQARYIEYIKGTLSKELTLDGMDIVIDSANGAGYKVAPLTLWELGANVISIGDTPNGQNINQDYGSTSLENIIDTVVKNKADIGIALDGDADRIIVIDENGEIVDGDTILAIIAKEWQETKKLKKNSVVATILSNIGLEDYLSSQSIELHRTMVGDRYVSQYMRKNGFNVGGEKSGHIILSDYSTTGDGILAALHILAIMKKNRQKISDLAKLIDPYPQIQKDFIIKEDQAPDIIQLRDLSEKHQRKIGDKGRVLIRLSGTEPLVRVMVESKDKKLLDQTLTEITTSLNELLN